MADHLKQALDAVRNKQYKAAEEYAIYALEDHEDDAKAWKVRAMAVAMQTTLHDFRINEALDYYQKAIDCSVYKSSIMLDIEKELSNILKVLVLLRIKNFEKNPCIESYSYFKEAKLNEVVIEKAKRELGFSNHAAIEYYEHLALSMNNAAVMTANQSVQEYGSNLEEKTSEKYHVHKECLDICMKMLETALGYSQERKTLALINDNYRNIMKQYVKIKSYKLNEQGEYVVDFSLTESELKIKEKQMSNFNSRKESKITEIENREIEKRKAYLDEHPREKQKLENYRMQYSLEHNNNLSRIRRLLNQKDSLTDQLTDLDYINEEYELPIIEKEKKKREEELNSLGLFKGKRKKELQKDIDELTNKIEEYHTVITNEKSKRKPFMDQYMKDLRNTNEELSKITEDNKQIERLIQDIDDRLSGKK